MEKKNKKKKFHNPPKVKITNIFVQIDRHSL